MTEDAFAGFFVGGLIVVLVGNLLTLAGISSWRAWTQGRKTERGAPLWSSVLLAITLLMGLVAVMTFAASVSRLTVG